MRVFITGATGYMGRAVVDALLKKGIEVLALVRPTRIDEVEARHGLAWTSGVLDDSSILDAAARETDATIHIAAQHDAGMEALDWAAIKAIGNALKGSGKAFIVTSAVSVYGNTGVEPRSEAEPILSPHPLREFRLNHDRFVVGLARDDVRSVVVRPPLVYGRAGGFLVALINQAVVDGVAFTIGDGMNRWSTVHVDDLADLYVKALLEPNARGVYNAGSHDTVCLRDVAVAIAARFAPQIGIASWTEEEACIRMGPLMALMPLEQRISSQRAIDELEWCPRSETLLEDLATGSYLSNSLVPYSH